MPEFDNTNKGALFVNERKENGKQPDYTGKINIDGVEKKLAGWKKESKSGKTFLSLSISDFKSDGQNGGGYSSGSGDNNIDFRPKSGVDSDIPF